MNSNPIDALRACYRWIRGRNLDDADRAALLKLGLTAIFFTVIVPANVAARVTRRATGFRKNAGGWREINESTSDRRSYERQL